MSDTIHLIVEKGPDQGKQISVPPEGARMGRSSKNDIVLEDPLLSRHHCRLFFKTGYGLWASDLGSANGTYLNGKEIQEVRLRVGDELALGDTVMKIMSDGSRAVSAVAAVGGEPVVDLGLRTDSKKPQRKGMGVGSLLVAAFLMIALAVVVWVPKLMNKSEEDGEDGQVEETYPKTLEIEYEKIEADANKAFRYWLQITSDNRICVKIDDTQNNRHVPQKWKDISDEYVKNLIRIIEESGFFDLDAEYRGIQPNQHDLKDLSITVGRTTRRVRVENRNEPEIFKEIRETIEECGMNEFGLQPIQYSTEELVEKAHNECLLGQKLYREKEIKYGNLHKAIKNYTLADWYLETVEPKPKFYRDVVSGMNICKEELQEKYEGRDFSVQKAKRVNNWEEAERCLQIILEMVPDNTDERYKKARRELLDVQTRMHLK